MKRLMFVSDSQEQPLNTVDLTRFGNEHNRSGAAYCAVLVRIRFAHTS